MRIGPLLAGFVILAAPATAVAASDLDFVLPPNDGYGIAECMKPGEACGQVIADAWCEAHGHAHATAFGPGEDVTGTIQVGVAATPVPPPGSVIIHCGE